MHFGVIDEVIKYTVYRGKASYYAIDFHLLCTGNNFRLSSYYYSCCYCIREINYKAKALKFWHLRLLDIRHWGFEPTTIALLAEFA